MSTNIKKAEGVRLGRPVGLADATRRRIVEDRGIAERLNEEEMKTAHGGSWYASTISAVLKSVELDKEATANRAKALKGLRIGLTCSHRATGAAGC